jgi:hypothetical protein
MAVGPEGFLRRWMLLDPIRVPIRSNAELVDSFVRAAIQRVEVPPPLTAVPREGDQATAGDAELTWHAVETSTYNVNLFHFANSLSKPTYNVVFWAVTVVVSPREMTNVRLAVGSNSASIWWVNGEEVVDLYGDRHLLADDGVSKRLTLRQGPNVVRAAVINGPGLSDMCARFLDASDRPVTGLTVQTEGSSQ